MRECRSPAGSFPPRSRRPPLQVGEKDAPPGVEGSPGPESDLDRFHRARERLQPVDPIREVPWREEDLEPLQVAGPEIAVEDLQEPMGAVEARRYDVLPE